VLDLLICHGFIFLIYGQDRVEILVLKPEIAQNFMNWLRAVVMLSCSPVCSASLRITEQILQTVLMPGAIAAHPPTVCVWASVFPTRTD